MRFVAIMALRIPATAASSRKINFDGTAFVSLKRPTSAPEIGAMKIARTILRNLFTKAVENEKYRTLSLANPKVAEKLLSQPSVVGFLLEVGFTNTGDSITFKGDITSHIDRLKAEFEGISSLLATAMQENANTANTAIPAKRKVPSAFAGAGKKSIKAQMREKEEAARKAKLIAERKRRKELLKGFEKDKEARKQPGWTAKLSGANRGAAPSAQASEGADLTAH